MKKTNTIPQPDQKSICKHCGKEYDKSEVRRVYGANSMVLFLNYCSSKCYTDVKSQPDQPSNTVGEWTRGEWEIKEVHGMVSKELMGYNIWMNGQHIAAIHKSITMPIEEARANAELIASAPKLQSENEALDEVNRELMNGITKFINQNIFHPDIGGFNTMQQLISKHSGK